MFSSCVDKKKYCYCHSHSNNELSLARPASRVQFCSSGSNVNYCTLISRWMTPARWHWMTASTTWRKKFLAACSGKAPRSVIKSNRSWDDSARSITKTKTSSASQASNNRTTPGTWDTWRRRQNSNGTRTPLIYYDWIICFSHWEEPLDTDR